jgi:mono/diheme cytochrome c family protein
MGRNVIFGAALLGAALAGCASARRTETVMAPLQLDARAQQGRAIFLRECQQCHPFGEAALGPAINNKPIPAPVMKLQVRTGVLGSMPAFSKQELSEEELDLVIDYVKALRHKGS